MTQYEEINRDPRRIHQAEQWWAEASHGLDKIIEDIRGKLPDLYRQAGGNTDASVVFDGMKSYIMQAEAEHGPVAHEATIIMAAAAMTRLVRTPRTD